jgi:hypothetical protein
MDFSRLNSAEQAHMSKVIEKKQVRSNGRSRLLVLTSFPQDARFLADVLESRRAMLQLVLQRLYKQSIVLKGGELMPL